MKDCLINVYGVNEQRSEVILSKMNLYLNDSGFQIVIDEFVEKTNI